MNHLLTPISNFIFDSFCGFGGIHNMLKLKKQGKKVDDIIKLEIKINATESIKLIEPSIEHLDLIKRDKNILVEESNEIIMKKNLVYNAGILIWRNLGVIK